MIDVPLLKKTVIASKEDETTYAYTAPEILSNDELHTIKSDMWALGIILYQLIAYNNHPFPSDNIKKAI